MPIYGISNASFGEYIKTESYMGKNLVSDVVFFFILRRIKSTFGVSNIIIIL